MHTLQLSSTFLVQMIKKHSSILILILFLASQATAQMSHDGVTPKGMQTGAPAGSFSLSGFENINPYSGNLNFSLPLLKIGGRGGAQSSINLTIDSAKWNVNFDVETEQGITTSWGGTYVFADQTTFSACSNDCNTSVEFSNVVVLDGRVFFESEGSFYHYVTVDDTVYGRRPGYGPGVLFSLSSSRGGPLHGALVSLTRLTFIAPDGTQYELRDRRYSGQPIIHTSTTPNPLSREKVFDSAEGEGITFVSDSDIIDVRSNDDGSPVVRYPSGTLYFSDGTAYKINQGNVAWIRDRNGNKISYGYDTSNRVTTIVDSLNRQVDITYETSTNNPNDLNETYDDISYYVDDITKRHIKIYHTKLDHALREDFRSGGSLSGILSYSQMFPELVDLQDPGPYNPPAIATKVVLPDNRSYDLSYTQYNEVARVKLPTGSAIEYDFATPNTTGSHIFRPVKERRVYENGGSKYPNNSPYDLKQTFDLSPRINSTEPYCSQANRCTDATVQEYFYDTTAMNNDRLVSKTIHSYFGVPNALDHNFYPLWREGREYQSEIYAPNSTTPLRRTIQEWNQQPVSWAVSHPEGTPSNNPRIISTTTELLDTGTNSKLVSKQVYGYDDTPAFRAFNNRTDVWEYAFGNGAPSNQLLRHTQTKYLVTDAAPEPTPSPSPDPSPTPNECRACPCVSSCRMEGESGPSALEYVRQHLYRLPAEVRVYQGFANNAEQLQARTVYAYDENASLLARSGITGWIDPQSPARGNVTTTKMWTAPTDNNAYVKTLAKYDIAGNVIETTDPNNAVAASPNVTTIRYTDCFGPANGDAHTNLPPSALVGQTYAFPTSITNTSGQSVYTKYDYYSGFPVTTEDVNGIKANMLYSDSLGRPTQVVQAAGTDFQTQMSIVYDDAARTVTTTSDLNTLGDNKLKNVSFYDRMGRTVETHVYESNSSYITTKWSYDGLGHAIKVTNPYRTINDPTYGAVEATYDTLGRLTNLATRPDNAEVTTAYEGNTTTVTDQAGKQRKSEVDALGRLAAIYEAPNDTANYNYQTSYSYDALGDLLTVTQEGQTRTFIYNGLSRLTSATNPESGTVLYTYDANGNMLEKTDPRLLPGISTHIKVSYTYDPLNRVTKRSYNDGTPEVNYYYDTQSLPAGAPQLAHGASIGCLLAITYGSSPSINGTYYGYDALGRTIESAQVTNGQALPTMEYGYTLSGNMIRQKYPSGREITTAYDEIGRFSSISGLKPGETAKTYASLPEYGAHGALTALKLGNGLWEHASFNARLQLTEIKLGTESNQESMLKLGYSYGTTDNNGNLKSQTITVPTVGTATGYTVTQNYEYDPLNRLRSATETNGSSQNWKQTYSYDRFGNRRLNYVNNGTTTPDVSLAYAQEAIYNPQVSGANNRLVGYLYDEAGNLTTDAQNRTFAYDAENRQITYNGGASINTGDSASYTYDGTGKRVKKQVGGSMVSTVFVYNILGQLVAEYTDSTDQRPAQTSYLTADNTGSMRVVTGQSQQVRERHDYLPFGENIGAQWGRTGNQGFDLNTVRQQFTGYEKDGESRLDYAQARYYGATIGRFMSPDPYQPNEASDNPQTWNRYNYCLNNPLLYIDPTGFDPVHWVTNGTTYKPLNDEEYQAYLKNENDEWIEWWSVAVGTNVGVLTGVFGESDFLSTNNPLVGQEVILGADGNFEVSNMSATGGAFGQEMARYVDAHETIMTAEYFYFSFFTIPVWEAGELTTLGIAGGRQGIGQQLSVGSGGSPNATQPTRPTTYLGQESGPSIPVPEGANGPSLADNGNGSVWRGGSGGNGLSPKVDSVRVMNPNAQNPTGYVNYGRIMKDGSWQSVHPYIGQSISKSSPWWHIPLN